MPSALLDTLNEAQREAVTAPDGPLLILAGAAYVVAAFTIIVLPDFARIVSWVALIFEMGEIPIVFWFLYRGLKPYQTGTG